MPIPLPNLDDRRWTELVDEGRSLIPVYSPEWTDFNPSDPGITLIELFAWIAEMDIYQLNRVPDRHKRKFLELIGVNPAPPQPAQIGLAFTVTGSDPARIPASTEFSVSGVVFRTLNAIYAGPGTLQSIQLSDGATFQDVSSTFPTEPVAPFGVPPKIGAAVYFGLTSGLPAAKNVSFLFHFAGGPVSPAAGPHHSAVAAWEYLDSFGAWSPLPVEDTTRSFSADGHVRIVGPASMKQQAVGRLAAPLFYVRVRYSSGEYDSPPRLLSAAWNAVEAEQAQTIAQDWVIAPGVIASGPAPAPGQMTAVLFGFDNKDRIDSLQFDPAGKPQFRILSYKPATATDPGLLAVELVLTARGTGGPGQQVGLEGGPPVIESSVALFTLESGAWRAWDLRRTLDSSGPADAHFTLDAQTGALQFGDGLRGLALPEDALLFASFLRTAAADAPVNPGQAASLLANEQNASLLGAVDLASQLNSVSTAFPATAGTDAEPLGDAIERAVNQREAPLRAVTLADYEALALATPGASIARVAARANVYAPLDCFEALGVVTVIVVPNMPVPMPRPSAGLLDAVRRYLNQRRVIGTRVEVVGPTYLQAAVNATVQSVEGQDSARVQKAIVDALNLFLDPLQGGPDGTGWPFGRDIYVTEIMNVIAGTPGVDHVINLQMVPTGCDSQCGNICLRPTWIATPGQHQIEVL